MQVDGPMVRRFHLRFDQRLMPGASRECRWLVPPPTAACISDLKTLIADKFGVPNQFLVIVKGSIMDNNVPTSSLDRDEVLYLQRTASLPAPAAKNRKCYETCGASDPAAFSKTQWERRPCQGKSARCQACIKVDTSGGGEATAPASFVGPEGVGPSVCGTSNPQEKREERRKDDDGRFYSAAEFTEYYGTAAAAKWKAAATGGLGMYAKMDFSSRKNWEDASVDSAVSFSSTYSSFWTVHSKAVGGHNVTEAPTLSACKTSKLPNSEVVEGTASDCGTWLQLDQDPWGYSLIHDEEYSSQTFLVPCQHTSTTAMEWES